LQFKSSPISGAITAFSATAALAGIQRSTSSPLESRHIVLLAVTSGLWLYIMPFYLWYTRRGSAGSWMCLECGEVIQLRQRFWGGGWEIWV